MAPTAMPSPGTEQLGVFRNQEAAVRNDCCMHGYPRTGLFVFKMDMILNVDCSNAWVCLADTSDATIWKLTAMCVWKTTRGTMDYYALSLHLYIISTQPSTLITSKCLNYDLSTWVHYIQLKSCNIIWSPIDELSQYTFITSHRCWTIK